jgi:hypothetical protein
MGQSTQNDRGMRRGANWLRRRIGVGVSLLGVLVSWFGVFQATGAFSPFNWHRLVGTGPVVLAGFIVSYVGDALRPRDEYYRATLRAKEDFTPEDRARRVQIIFWKVLLFLSGMAVMELLGDLHANPYMGPRWARRR